jgi:hypothetical protein
MSRFAGMNIGFPTGTTARDRNREAEQLNLYNQKKPITVKPSTVKNQNVFTPMDKQVSPAISQKAFKKVYGEDAKQSGNVSQYRNLTDLMKANMDSLSGKIRIRDDRYPDREAYVPPGYDSDMVPFAVKISAGRLDMDPKKYMDMGLMDRVKNFGTEARSMGQELTTGVGQAFDAGKQLFSNLPMFGMFGGNKEADTSGIMSTALQSYDEGDSFTQQERFDPLAGMSAEMRAFYMGLSPEDQTKFLGLDNSGRTEMMKPSESQEDQNFNFLGQYSTSGPMKDMT